MIRISSHASDQAVLILRIDQLHNTVIGSFQPARRQDDMGVGVYVMEASSLDSLKAWARYQNIHLLNESRDLAEPTTPLQCGNVTDTHDGAFDEICCAPYPSGRIPRYCGACGQTAKPVTFGDDEPTIGVKCPACARVNHGGARFCLACAGRLPDRHLSVSAIPRTKGEPRPLAETIAELEATL